jgi:4-carboxymuconolactone decarboxylase
VDVVAEAEETIAERHERGFEVRRTVLGDEHVDRAIAGTTVWDEPFQHFITGTAWADVWGRPGLGLADRSLVTIALLAALGHDRELEMHLRAARRTGAAPERIAEVLLHVALYAGVPAANTAFGIFKRVMAERDDLSGPAGEGGTA